MDVIRQKFNNFKNLYPEDMRQVLILLLGFIIISLTKIIPIPLSVTVFLIILFFLILSTPFVQRNIFTIMLLHLILIPTFITFILWVMIIYAFNSSHILIEWFPLYALPFISISFVMMDFQDIELLKKVKISLEYNNALFILITGLLAIYSFKASDFNMLISFSTSSDLQGDLNAKDAFNLMVSVLGLPFLVSNAFTKAFIDHRLYHHSKKKQD